jgi:hypothetical protein
MEQLSLNTHHGGGGVPMFVGVGFVVVFWRRPHITPTPTNIGFGADRAPNPMFVGVGVMCGRRQNTTTNPTPTNICTSVETTDEQIHLSLDNMKMMTIKEM